jgi:hypothetical protein
MKMMDVSSKVVDRRLSGSGSAPAIMEIAAAKPPILDKLVEARARTEAPPSPPPPAPDLRPAAVAPEPPAAARQQEPEPIDMEDTDADLLDMVASEAGQPPAADPTPPPEPSPSPALALIEELPQPEPEPEPEPTPGTPFAPEQLLAADLAQIEAMEADLAAVESELNAIEEAAEPSVEAEPDLGLREPAYSEGPGDDFQALLAGARPAPEDTEDAMASLMPASADVRLRARNGPHPGAEFSGKSTLAGASGVYCLVDHFDLPAGTRMKVTLMTPRFDDHIEVQDALVARVRKAPGDATEVQLAFEDRHPEVSDFVEKHFGDKPGFSFFGRRRKR